MDGYAHTALMTLRSANNRTGIRGCVPGDSLYLIGIDQEYAIVSIYSPVKGIVDSVEIVPVTSYGMAIGPEEIVSVCKIDRTQIN
jgi:hypothetical protein